MTILQDSLHHIWYGICGHCVCYIQTTILVLSDHRNNAYIYILYNNKSYILFRILEVLKLFNTFQQQETFTPYIGNVFGMTINCLNS